MEATSPILYIVKTGAANAGELARISPEDKETLKRWAAEEMQVLGIPAK